MDTDRECKKAGAEYDAFLPEYAVMQSEFTICEPETTLPLPEYMKLPLENENLYDEKNNTVLKETKKEKNRIKQYLVLCAMGIVMLSKILTEEPAVENTTEVTVSDKDFVDFNETETKQEQQIYIPELDEAYSALYEAVLSEDYDTVIHCAETYLDTIRKYHGDSHYFGVGFDEEHAFALYEDPYISETYYSEYDFKGMVVEFLQSYSGEEWFHLRIGISDYTDEKLNGNTIYAVMYYNPESVWTGETYADGAYRFVQMDYVKVAYIDGVLQDGAVIKLYDNSIKDKLDWVSYTTNLLKNEYGNYIMAEDPVVEASEWLETTGGKVPVIRGEGTINDITLYSMSKFQAFADCTAE